MGKIVFDYDPEGYLRPYEVTLLGCWKKKIALVPPGKEKKAFDNLSFDGQEWENCPMPKECEDYEPGF